MNPSPRPGQQTSPAPRSFAGLSRRMAGWATNLLATGLILILGLTVGREVIGWWRGEETPAKTATVDDGKNPASEPLTLAAGARGALAIHRVHGQRAEAIERLRQLGARAVDQPPGPSSAASSIAPPGGEWPTPVSVGKHGSVYEIPGGLPLVIAAATERGRSKARLLFWGMACPAGEQDWTLYCSQPGMGISGEGALAPIPLPPQALPTVALGASMSGTTVFSTTQPSERIMDYYEEWFAEHRGEWQVARPWQRLARVWSMSAVQNSKPAVRVDIYVTLAANGMYQGIITTAAKPSGH